VNVTMPTPMHIFKVYMCYDNVQVGAYVVSCPGDEKDAEQFFRQWWKGKRPFTVSVRFLGRGNEAWVE
jgi:hypothetical protein